MEEEEDRRQRQIQAAARRIISMLQRALESPPQTSNRTETPVCPVTASSSAPGPPAPRGLDSDSQGKASMDPESPDFVPSLFSNSKQNQCTEAPKKMDRFSRRRKRAEAVDGPSVTNTQSSTGPPDSQPPDCPKEIKTNDEAGVCGFTHPDWAPSLEVTTDGHDSSVKAQSEEKLKEPRRLNVKKTEMESSSLRCDQTVSLQTTTQSEGKVSHVLEEAEPQTFSAVDVKRWVMRSGIQCPYCRCRCGTMFSLQIHVGSQHPLRCEDVCVGRLGKVVFYQPTAKLFHCHLCFFTSKDYAVVFEHLLVRHCVAAKAAVQMEKGGEVDTEEGHGEGQEREQDRNPNPEVKPDNDDTTDHHQEQTSSQDSLKRKRSSVSSGEDEDEDVNMNVSDSGQADSEEQAAAVERYSECSGTPYYDCRLCKQRCKSKHSLLLHVSRKHDVPKPHACKECSETFMLESLLIHHTNLHHRQEVYQCPYCGSESSLQGLHQHLSLCRAEDIDEDKAHEGIRG